nr:hypothetical protein [Tanacetum cinerariifolium]
KKLHKLRQILAYEYEAEELAMQVNLTMRRPVAVRQALLPKMAAHLEKAQQLNQKAKTFTTFMTLYRLRLVQAELAGDYKAIIR